ncbi:MAG: hypothetical protein HKN00_13865 [Flavobacteriaceae bacterium]|nr:hypothetical protein [Bacteroidia bacterium]MBT8286904.1 hypothetical protein [Bacteroidia bacterium]NNF76267.1 hypothetical protein [Flavobacteriaceae bacterium]NNK73037.1 hypothetical protein [Flavobacteriaceae bacterium]
MKAIVLRKEIEPLPIQAKEPLIETYEGILNSDFKQVAKENFFNAEPDSIYATKRRVRNYHYSFPCNAETFIKLTFFAIVLAVVLN